MMAGQFFGAGGRLPIHPATVWAGLRLISFIRRVTGALLYGFRRFFAPPSTVRPLARETRVLIGWPLPLGLGLGGCLLLARRGRVCV